jgi:hypothetical protein
MAKQKKISPEITEAEMKDWEEKLISVFFSAATLAECSSEFLKVLYELNQCPLYMALLDKDPEEMSSHFYNSVYSAFPSIRCLVHEFSDVKKTAINVGQTPTLENFATLSSLSNVNEDQPTLRSLGNFEKGMHNQLGYRDSNQLGSQTEHFQTDTDDSTPYRLILSHFRQHSRFKPDSSGILLKHFGSELGLCGFFPE